MNSGRESTPHPGTRAGLASAGPKRADDLASHSHTGGEVSERTCAQFTWTLPAVNHLQAYTRQYRTRPGQVRKGRSLPLPGPPRRREKRVSSERGVSDSPASHLPRRRIPTPPPVPAPATFTLRTAAQVMGQQKPPAGGTRTLSRGRPTARPRWAGGRCPDSWGALGLCVLQERPHAHVRRCVRLPDRFTDARSGLERGSRVSRDVCAPQRGRAVTRQGTE